VLLGIKDGIRSAIRKVAGYAPPALWIAGDAGGERLAVGRVRGRAPTQTSDRHRAARTDAGIRRTKEGRHRLAVDIVVARPMNRERSRGQGHRAEGAPVEVVLPEIRQQVEKVVAPHAAVGERSIADAGRQMAMVIMVLVGGQAELLE